MKTRDAIEQALCHDVSHATYVGTCPFLTSQNELKLYWAYWGSNKLNSLQILASLLKTKAGLVREKYSLLFSFSDEITSFSCRHFGNKDSPCMFTGNHRLPITSYGFLLVTEKQCGNFIHFRLQTTEIPSWWLKKKWVCGKTSRDLEWKAIRDRGSLKEELFPPSLWWAAWFLCSIASLYMASLITILLTGLRGLCVTSVSLRVCFEAVSAPRCSNSAWRHPFRFFSHFYLALYVQI